MRTDALAVSAAIKDYDRMRQIILDMHPELAGDEEFLEEALQAEASLDDMVVKLIKGHKEDEALAKGLAAYIADLQARKSRLLASAEKKKAVAKSALLATNRKGMKTPAFTLTISDLEDKIEISEPDINMIPDEYVSTTTIRTVDLNKVKTALQNGLDLGFVVIHCDRTSMTVRLK